MADTPTETTLVRYEQPAPHVALVTLDRPDKRNAVNAALAADLEAALRRSEADRAIRGVILTSSRDKVFCAGADLSAIAAGKGLGIETAAGGFAGFTHAPRTKPWIAAVEGLALAGGCEIVLACDMVVASESAQFGLPEVKRGLMAGAGGVNRLGTLLPRNIANELIVIGDPLDAARAHQWGLVNRLTQPGGTLAAALALAEAIAVNAPLAVQYSLGAARMSMGQPDGFGRTLMAERFLALRQTDDFREGPRAFVEKRAPVWTGR